jgi:Tol biopolymer transport system component
MMKIGLLLLAAIAANDVSAALPSYASDRPMPDPVVFAPGVISAGDFDSHPAFMPDGNTVYFVRSAPNFRFWSILVSHYAHGKWSEPEVAPFSGQYSDADPFITRDGKRFFFISKRPVDGRVRGDTDIYVMDRTADGWSEPKNAGATISSPKDEYYPTLADDGTLYFGSERDGGLGVNDLYRARAIEGGWRAPENLGAAINTKDEEYEPYIAPDQSFLIFMACGRADSLGQCDLYLSRNENGTWTKPGNLGPKINSERTEYSPKLSPDGRYFFWTSARNGMSDAPQSKRLGYADLMRAYRSSGNGMCDIFEIDAAQIGLAVPAVKEASR